MSESNSRRPVAILGASPKSDRYSHMAQMRLMDAGYTVLPVNPAYSEVEGIMALDNVVEAAAAAGPDGLDTLTLYLGPKHSEPMIDDIIAARPRRVIFNPGTESHHVQIALDKSGIPWMKACTLVLLSTNQY